MFAAIDYELKNVQPEAVWEHVIQGDSQWAFPSEGSYKRRLRELRTDYPRFKKNAKKLQKHILENFTEEGKYEEFCNLVYSEENVKMAEEIEEIFRNLNG